MMCTVTVGVYRYTASHHIVLDADSLCPAGGPRAVTVVLVDGTDRLSRPQAAHARHEVGAALNAMTTGELLQIYLVGAGESSWLTPVFSKCHPGNGDDVNALVANPRRAERRWTEQYTRPLTQVLDSLFEGEEGARSPLLEAIQSVALQSFGTPGHAVPRRLIVISDLLQHSDLISHYRALPTFSQWRSTSAYSHALAELDAVRIDIHYVLRGHARQTPAHQRFWADYLTAQGARLERFNPISG